MPKTLDGLERDVDVLLDAMSYVQTTFEEKNYDSMLSELLTMISDAAKLADDIKSLMNKE